jgi:hypothetical protein
VFFSFRN